MCCRIFFYYDHQPRGCAFIFFSQRAEMVEEADNDMNEIFPSLSHAR